MSMTSALVVTPAYLPRAKFKISPASLVPNYFTVVSPLLAELKIRYFCNVRVIYDGVIYVNIN